MVRNQQCTYVQYYFLKIVKSLRFEPELFGFIGFLDFFWISCKFGFSRQFGISGKRSNWQLLNLRPSRTLSSDHIVVTSTLSSLNKWRGHRRNRGCLTSLSIVDESYERSTRNCRLHSIDTILDEFTEH